MTACAIVLVLAGLVAVFAGAVGADRAAALRLAGESSAGAPAAAPSDAPAPSSSPAEEPEPAPATPSEERVPDAASSTSLALLPGWRVVPSQDVVEVPPGRFAGATVLQRGEGTVVLVGLADPARVPPRADPAAPDPAQEEALAAEARRLADAYAELLAPGAETASLTDNAEVIADLPTRTSVRRVEGGGLDGALVRVSTLAATGRTLTVLAVARPAPDIDAQGDAADALVRSLRLEPAP
ncbi:hypothetical protein ACQPX6_07355 [Actinomycetospora sp. CA-101289]|uniref:hypothetical protein n=1 Tax=Actinomycetospora sp. CA-101289 TaxID=3239893 RepID=UPI003D98C8D6